MFKDTLVLLKGSLTCNVRILGTNHIQTAVFNNIIFYLFTLLYTYLQLCY